MLHRLTLLSAVLFCFAAPSLAATLPTTTRKVVLEPAGQGFGFKLIEAPLPPLGEHQALVRVRAIALNRGDVEMKLKEYGRAGLVPGSDAAGDVIAVGSAVRDFKVGDRVTSLYFRAWTGGPASTEKLKDARGASFDGVFAEYVVIDDTGLAKAPKGLSYEEAATLPTAGLTGWMATSGQHPIDKDDVVLVQGTGGVSIFALQFAAASGARVIATSSSDDKLRRAQEIGARDGINYKATPEWGKRVLELTNGRGADVVVDVGGKSTLDQSARSLAYGGVISIVGGLSGYDGSIPALRLLMRTARAQGIFVGSREDYQRMGRFIEQRKVRPVIDRTFSFAEFQTALDYLEAGNFVGKVVLKVE